MHKQDLTPTNVGSVLNTDQHHGLFSYTCINISKHFTCFGKVEPILVGPLVVSNEVWTYKRKGRGQLPIPPPPTPP